MIEGLAQGMKETNRVQVLQLQRQTLQIVVATVVNVVEEYHVLVLLELYNMIGVGVLVGDLATRVHVE